VVGGLCEDDMRKSTKIVIGFATGSRLRPGVCLLFVGLLLGVLGCMNGPSIRLSGGKDSFTVDVQTLGEYPTTVSRITISDSDKLTLLDLRAKEGDAQIRDFTLKKGENDVPAIVVEHGSLRQVTPQEGTTYFLKPNVEYTVTIWGKRWPSRVKLRFQP
jgi:hypothetical protein